MGFCYSSPSWLSQVIILHWPVSGWYCSVNIALALELKGHGFHSQTRAHTRRGKGGGVAGLIPGPGLVGVGGN